MVLFGRLNGDWIKKFEAKISEKKFNLIQKNFKNLVTT